MLRSVDGMAVTMADGALSYVRSPDLPYFEEPPVREVAIAIQFQSLPLRAVDLGGLRDRLSDGYPIVHERPPAPFQIENFTRPRGSELQVQFKLAVFEPYQLTRLCDPTEKFDYSNRLSSMSSDVFLREVP